MRLSKSFYQREDAVDIAKELLGKLLVTNIDGQRTSGIIVETEAYAGVEDKASHAYGGKRTSRRSNTMTQLPHNVAFDSNCFNPTCSRPGNRIASSAAFTRTSPMSVQSVANSSNNNL